MPEKKQRHGCLTAYLIIIIISVLFSEMVYLFSGKILPGETTATVVSDGELLSYILIGIFDIVCVIALFNWKKWGFWGICISTVILFFMNLIAGLTLMGALAGLIRICILYGVLHIGRANKGWPQLD